MVKTSIFKIIKENQEISEEILLDSYTWEEGKSLDEVAQRTFDVLLINSNFDQRVFYESEDLMNRKTLNQYYTPNQLKSVKIPRIILDQIETDMKSVADIII